MTLRDIADGFLTWLGTGEARTEEFRWFLRVVVLGGPTWLVLKAFSFSGGAVINRLKSREALTNVVGHYYLYHPPLILEFTSLPRVSRVALKRGFTVPGKITQTDANNSGYILYKGTFVKHRSVLVAKMESPRGDCPKLIVLWDLMATHNDRGRAAVGVMACVNYHGEPYRAPIIVTEWPVGRQVVDEIFRLLGASTITRDLRWKAFETLQTAPPADPNEAFVHMVSPAGPLIEQVGWWKRIAARVRSMAG